MILEKGLPASVETERLVLGAALTDPTAATDVFNDLSVDDFSLEKHRRIFAAAADLHAAGEQIDRVSVYGELRRRGQAESVDGLGYLVSLDDGLPRLYNMEGYTRLIRDKAILRKVMYAAQSLSLRCQNEEPPAEILASAEKILADIGDSARIEQPDWVTPAQVVQRFPGGMDAFFAGRAKSGVGLSTPWTRLNDITAGGLYGGELWIFAGRPSMGKTAMAMQLAAHVAKQKGVAVFSLEMSRDALTERLIASEARVDLQRLRGGWLSPEERRRIALALTEIDERQLFIEDKGADTLDRQQAALRKLMSKHKIGLAIVDHLHLMRAARRAENQNLALGEISSGWKRAAVEYDIPVVLLAQLSRDCERRPGDHEPILADLRESGRIEQDADVVGFVYREEVYKPDREDIKGHARFIVAKQRNGPIGKVKLAWLSQFVKFETFAGEAE